jgi:hypothetical protein
MKRPIKWGLITGSTLALIDFILLGGRLIVVCALDMPVCGEGWAVLLLHIPTSYIFYIISDQAPYTSILGSTLIALAGLIQYFIAGFVIGGIAEWISTKPWKSK